MREVFVFDPAKGEVVPRDERGPVQRVHIIRDGMDHLWHPADDKHYDSKSKFRAVTRAHGLTEKGNDREHRAPARTDISHADVARAYDQVASGYRPTVRHENEY